jgi:hypothetical protein
VLDEKKKSKAKVLVYINRLNLTILRMLWNRKLPGNAIAGSASSRAAFRFV